MVYSSLNEQLSWPLSEKISLFSEWKEVKIRFIKEVNMAEKNSANESGKNCQGADDNDKMTTTEYCARLQQWMWRYYSGYVSWQSWVLMSAPLFPTPQFGCQAPGSSASGYPATAADIAGWYNQMSSPGAIRPADTATFSTADRGAAQPAGTVNVSDSSLLRRKSS